MPASKRRRIDLNKAPKTQLYYAGMPRWRAQPPPPRVPKPMVTTGYRPNTVELKVNDLPTETISANLDGDTIILCNPQLGSDFNQRIGRKITLKSVYIRFWLYPTIQNQSSGAFVGPAQVIRIIILWDKQPTGGLPSNTDILATANPVSHINLNNRDRFQILSDKFLTLSANLLSTTNQYVDYGNTYAWKKFKRLNHEMIFNSSTGSTADITSGALYLYVIGSRPSGSTDALLSFSSRVRYKDN